MPFSKLLIAATLVVASADVPTLTSKYCADVVEVRRGVTHVLTELRAFPLEYEAAISDAVVVCPPSPRLLTSRSTCSPVRRHGHVRSLHHLTRPIHLPALPRSTSTRPTFLLAHPHYLKTLTVEGSAPQTGRSYTLCVDNSKIRYSTTASDGSSIGIFNGTDYWHLTADTTKVRGAIKRGGANRAHKTWRGRFRMKRSSPVRMRVWE